MGNQRNGISYPLIWAVLWVVLILSALIIENSLGRIFGADYVAPTIAFFITALLAVPPWITWALNEHANSNHGDAADAYKLHAPQDKERELLAVPLWNYERSQYFASLPKCRLNALLFGALYSVLMATACSLLVLVIVKEWQGPLAFRHAGTLLISVMGAATASFLLLLERCIRRSASSDLGARMFSSCTRTLIFAVIGDVGLFAVLHGAQAQLVESVPAALLLGAFSGALGEDALRLMLSKAPAPLKLGEERPTAAQPAAILEGLSTEDSQRFEEESVFTVSDLALIPTARLFLNTGHSLQRICEWQDQALLILLVGADRAKRLGQALEVRRASQLVRLAERLALSKSEAVAHVAAVGATVERRKVAGVAVVDYGDAVMLESYIPEPDSSSKKAASEQSKEDKELTDALAGATDWKGEVLLAKLKEIKEHRLVRRVIFYSECTAYNGRELQDPLARAG